MRTFYLERLEDETGISGTGKIAEGVQFTDGKVAMNWLTEVNSIGIYDNVENVVKIHGHGGKTQLVWEGPQMSILDIQRRSQEIATMINAGMDLDIKVLDED